MTVEELNTALWEHCEDMKREMPGFLFYGILSCKDGELLCKAENTTNILTKDVQSGASFHLVIINQVKQILSSSSTIPLTLDNVLIETDKITFLITLSALGKFFSITALEKSKANIGISRALLAQCKAKFGTVLDDTF